jgi:hypothetical protein
LKELSLHILDIAQNSIKAKATDISIKINENPAEDLLEITITDNGCGMSKELLERVKDPFATTRTTRKVGMGISLFEAAAVQCGGKLDITSKVNVGTTLTVTFELDNIDRAPIGDMAGTMQTLISGSPAIEFIYRHEKNSKVFVLDTRELKQVLGEVPLDTPEVLLWIEGYVNEGLSEIN